MINFVDKAESQEAQSSTCPQEILLGGCGRLHIVPTEGKSIQHPEMTVTGLSATCLLVLHPSQGFGLRRRKLRASFLSETLSWHKVCAHASVFPLLHRPGESHLCGLGGVLDICFTD